MLEFIKQTDRRGSNNQIYALYKCNNNGCQNIFETRMDDVKNNKSKSCGCSIRKHQMCNTLAYKSWTSMKARCLNPNATGYENYGGRGISICQLWLYSFEEFYKDMGPRLNKNDTIDRTDSDGNYCPNNCRWENKDVQNNKKRNSVYLTSDNKIQTAAQWGREKNIPYHTLIKRLGRNWSVEKALTTPVDQKKANKKAKFRQEA